jgi:hypothetical protein
MIYFALQRSQICRGIDHDYFGNNDHAVTKGFDGGLF